MKHKIYKGGVDNYPLWWYGQSNRLQNFGDRTNFLTPHGAIFKGNGYYFNSANGDYLEDIYGRHLVRENSDGVLSYLYLTDGEVPPCGSVRGNGNALYLAYNQEPLITGKLICYPEYCPNLVKIDFPGNKISIVDVSRLVSLIFLICFTNQLSIIDVSKLTVLENFRCDNNLLSILDVSNNSKITNLLCNNNLMDSAAVDKVLCDANAWNTSNGTLDISGNTAPSQAGIDARDDMVNNRGWTVTVDS